MSFRLGVVSYLNCIHLYHSLLGSAEIEFIERLPADLTELLEAGEVDVALLPLFEYLRGVGEALVPGVSIASDGPVQSVALFLNKPLPEVRSIAADRGSRSSVALLRVLLKERYAIAPNLSSRKAQLDTMLASFDAALIIGDEALRAQRRGGFASVLDLGAEWTNWTHLPFVYAAWTTRAGLTPAQCAELTQMLNRARNEGMTRLERIAAEQRGRGGLDEHGILEYLTHNIQTEFSERHRLGAEEYGRYCVKHGLLPKMRPLTFCGDAE